MDYARIQRRDAGCAAGALINPKSQKAATNFAAKNVQNMRAKAQAAKDKAIVEQPKMPFKMKQFDGVEGKVRFEAQKPREVAVVEKPFLQRGQGKMAQPVVPEGGASPRHRVLGEARAQVPRAAEAVSKPTHEKKNHILVNRLIAEHVGQERRAPEKAPKDVVGERLKHQFGKVPAYLSGIKQELADKQRIAEEMSRKEDVPPGYRLMPDDEREETLANLREKLSDMEKKHQQLPLNIESERAKRAQKEIETKLGELENAIKLFSKQKVLIEL